MSARESSDTSLLREAALFVAAYEAGREPPKPSSALAAYIEELLANLDHAATVAPPEGEGE